MITWCCKPDCPGRNPACHGTCEKYKAWAAAVKAEKAYTKDMVSRDRVNRSDYVKEGWMAHKGQRRRKKKQRKPLAKGCRGLWRQRSRIKSAGCCRSVPAAGGSLYTIYFIAG